MKKEENVGVNDLEPFIMTLKNLGAKNLAKQVLDVFAKNAFSFEQQDNISKCYFKLQHYEEAIKHGEKALVNAHSPQLMYMTRFNLINVYNHANYPEKALTYINANEKLIPMDYDLQLEKAYALFLSNRKTEAEEILHHVLANYKELPEETALKIKFNLGTYYLYRDKFQEGLRHFILDGAKMRLWNTETIFSRNKKLNLPFWEGSPDVKNLVIYAEAGSGDEIINIRFMKHLKERGINAYWYAVWHKEEWKNERKGLLEIFKNSGFPVVTNLEELKDVPDLKWTYSMHLPIYLNLDYKDLWDKPYISSSKEYDDKCKLEGKSPKIGIRWQGCPAYDHDLHRSFKVKELHEVLKDVDGTFYSLQRDNGLEEIEDFPNLIDLSEKMNSFQETLGFIRNLDFVITSCTSIAHLCAASGKEVFVMVPISAYYVWSHSGDKSPWYGDNVTLLRQEKPRCWKAPLEKLRKILIEKGLLK